MRRSLAVLVAVALLLAGILPVAGVVGAEQGQARVRVVHASPDAPAVDVLVDGNPAFTDIAFGTITPYATLSAGPHSIKVVPAGASEPVVIDATVDLTAGTDYTVAAVGQLANIEALVLVDNNTPTPEGKAEVRFVHASPNAPAVDIAVKGGPVLFSNVSFKGVGSYVAVDPGTYDLEVRLAGTDQVVLEVPGVTVNAGSVYTVFAVGLVDGQPPLQALLSLDNAGAGLPMTGGVAMDIGTVLFGLAAFGTVVEVAIRRRPR